MKNKEMQKWLFDIIKSLDKFWDQTGRKKIIWKNFFFAIFIDIAHFARRTYGQVAKKCGKKLAKSPS